MDPLTKKYPELTPYQFASNRPIDGIDLDGREHSFYVLRQHANSPNIELVNVYTLDAQMKDVFGNYRNLNISTGAYILGSDGSWRKIPNELSNTSLQDLGDAEDVMGIAAAEWENADATFNTLMGVESAGHFGRLAEAGVAIASISGGLSRFTGLRSWKSFIIEGIKFENKYFSKLAKEGKRVFRRVSFKAKNAKGEWVRAVVDGVVKNKDGTVDFIETKLRSTTKLTKNQKIVYKAMESGDAVAVGKNAEKAGFKVGQKVKAKVKRVNKYE